MITLRPLYAHLYEKILKFLHVMVPECTLRAVILDWLPSQANLLGQQQKLSHSGLS